MRSVCVIVAALHILSLNFLFAPIHADARSADSHTHTLTHSHMQAETSHGAKKKISI